MAVTLSQVAKLQTEPLERGILMNLLREAPILEYLPFENVQSLTNIAVRWTNLPSVGWRRINQGYTKSSGDVEQVQESLYAFGGEIELDRVYRKIQGSFIVQPERLQVEMKTKAMAYEFTDKFLNGDHASEPDGIEGLKKRISNMPSRQTVAFTYSSADLDPTNSAAKASHFLNKLEEAHYKAGRGSANVILCNEAVKWGLGRVIRYASVAGAGWVDTTKDLFDREVLTYKGIPLIDVGLKPDQSTEVITVTETGSDSSDTTSMYFVPFNREDGVIGIQLSDMEIYDPLNGAERDSMPTNLIRVEWWVGLAGYGSYGPVRLWDLKDPAGWT